MVSGGWRGVVTRVPRSRGRDGRVAGGRPPITNSGASRGWSIPSHCARLLLGLVTGKAGICRGAMGEFLKEGVTLLPPVVLVAPPVISVSAPRAAPATATPAAAVLTPEKVFLVSRHLGGGGLSQHIPGPRSLVVGWHLVTQTFPLSRISFFSAPVIFLRVHTTVLMSLELSQIVTEYFTCCLEMRMNEASC